ncbi:MAG: hypothetical protein PW786_02660 [Arachidicoccus sp.]|nr:hypothetical protein [Arachidicoccus sp.]
MTQSKNNNLQTIGGISLLIIFYLLAIYSGYLGKLFLHTKDKNIWTTWSLILSQTATWSTLGIVALYARKVEKQPFLLWKTNMYGGNYTIRTHYYSRIAFLVPTLSIHYKPFRHSELLPIIIALDIFYSYMTYNSGYCRDFIQRYLLSRYFFSSDTFDNYCSVNFQFISSWLGFITRISIIFLDWIGLWIFLLEI